MTSKTIVVEVRRHKSTGFWAMIFAVIRRTRREAIRVARRRAKARGYEIRDAFEYGAPLRKAAR